MGASSYTFAGGGGGGGGANWWTNGGAGTVISPINIVTAILAKFGFFSLKANSTTARFEYDDGAGNVGILGLTAAGFGSSLQDAAGNIASIAGSPTNTSNQVTDAAGNQGLLRVTAAGIDQSVTDAAGNAGGIVITNVSASILSTPAGGGNTALLGVNSTKNGIVTDQVTGGVGVMPAVTVGQLAVYDGSGTLLGQINLT